MSRQPGSPAARAACRRRRRMVSGWRLKTGVTASITASSGRMASRASTAAGPRYNTTPSASWSVFDSGIRMRPLPSPASSTSPQRRAAASETRSSPSCATGLSALWTSWLVMNCHPQPAHSMCVIVRQASFVTLVTRWLLSSYLSQLASHSAIANFERVELRNGILVCRQMRNTAGEHVDIVSPRQRFQSSTCKSHE